MLRSRFASLIAVAMLSVGALAYETVHRVHDAFDYCVSRVKLVAAFAADLFLGTASPTIGARHDIKPVQSLLAAQQSVLAAQQSVLAAQQSVLAAQQSVLAAQQSVLRQAKRERPRIETTFRRCSST
jgi:hypothetical protein